MRNRLRYPLLVGKVDYNDNFKEGKGKSWQRKKIKNKGK